jgi:hypothetical protein
VFLSYLALLLAQEYRIPNGIRTRVAALKGRSPRPLDDGDQIADDMGPWLVAVGDG